MIRLCNAFPGFLFAGLLVTSLWFSNCSSGSECLDLTLEGEPEVIPPAGVRVSFSMATCDGEPVPDMLEAIQNDQGEFTVTNNETGKPFGSEGESAPDLGRPKNFSFYSIILLDLSNSIVQPDNPELSKLQEELYGARAFIEQVVEAEPEEELKFAVALYVFGGTENSELWTEPDRGQAFTKDHTVLYDRLKALENDEGRGSTNLYGSFLEGLRLVRNQGGGEMVIRSLVILTDGTHETGDTEQMRQQARDSLNDTEKPAVDAYSIAIEGDYNPDAIRELASDPDKNFLLVEEAGAGELGEAFKEIAARVKAWSESTYVVGICSPLEGPNRSLTINAKRKGSSGKLEIHYDATGFNLVGCESGLVANPCEDRKCGFVHDVVCGTCGGACCNPGEFCREDGTCLDVCVERECGTVEGVNCGNCSGDKPFCNPDGRCVSSLNCPTGMAMIESLWVCIDRWEASRPDATSASQGTGAGAARSVAGVIPWSDVSWTGAANACTLAGKQLCTAEEWSAACSGPLEYTYPYGFSYNPDACNGGDHGAQGVVPTGSMLNCEGGYDGIFDMSGNLWEWNADCQGDQCTQMGGAWYIAGNNISCETSRNDDKSASGPNVGFRCCLSL